MSEYFIKPSLASLPTELFHMIFPYAINLDVALEDRFKLRRYRSLRALSQTCHSLREYVLPFIYARIEVCTIKKLGQLHETLKSRPCLATLVKSFRFIWDMDGDCEAKKLNIFAAQEGSTLDLAFRDRLQLYDMIVETPKGDLENAGCMPYPGDVMCRKPGRCPDWRYVQEHGAAANGVHFGGTGPDGNGEDKRIKSPRQLISCITEVVRMLTKIEAFGWETPVTPMPTGVFDALLQHPALTDLRLVFSAHRGNFCNLPLWQLAGNLRLLDLQWEHRIANETLWPLNYGHDDRNIPSTIERVLERPLALSAYMEVAHVDEEQARSAVHHIIAERTIIAAAQGGRLRRLNAMTWCSGPEHWYKIRMLLPFWLAIEEWGSVMHMADDDVHVDFALDSVYVRAALSLRSFFAHFSRYQEWRAPGEDIAQATSGFVQDRRLTQLDFKKLQLYYEARVMGDDDDRDAFESVFEFYLPWLLEDAKLGQQVLDAWNAMVERGEADKVECFCETCNP